MDIERWRMARPRKLSILSNGPKTRSEVVHYHPSKYEQDFWDLQSMHIPSQAAIELLHRVPDGTLSTLTREPQGFPYPTARPFAPSVNHAPADQRPR